MSKGVEKAMFAEGLASPSGNLLYFDRERICIMVLPKVACTSIKQTMSVHYDSREHRRLTAEMMATLPSGYPDWRYSLRALRLATPERRDGGDWLKIAFVRNPWERARSMYCDKCKKKKHPNWRLRDMGFYKDMPFRRFARLINEIPDTEAEKHFRSQHLTSHLLGPPDLILTFERLSDSWRIVQKLFREHGKQTLPDLPRLNDTSSIRRPPWDSETVGLIGERYERDIELLGYEGEKPRA